MRQLVLPSTTAILLFLAVPAQATPLAPVTAPPGGEITRVSDGCGPFGHRSHYGYCKDNAHPEMTYEPGEYPRPPYYGGGYRRGPRFYDEGMAYEPRCFIRETYEGPVRICR